jgi:hypothetical protein
LYARYGGYWLGATLCAPCATLTFPLSGWGQLAPSASYWQGQLAVDDVL